MPTDGDEVRWWRLVVLSAAAATAVAAAYAAAWRALRDPAVIFLRPEGTAVWVRPDRPFNGGPQLGPVDVHSEYRTTIECDSAVTGAVLSYRALRGAEIRLDGEVLASVPPRAQWDRWREVRSVELPPLAPGPHRIEAFVVNHNGPALWQAWCEPVGLSASSGWEARVSGIEWRPAKSVHAPWIPSTARQAPSLAEALRSRGWVLVAIFGGWLAVLAGLERRTRLVPTAEQPGRVAARVRWLIIGLWGLLAVNNELKLPFYGFDSKAHSDYMLFILQRRRIPFADDGWQMFQSPLYHLLGAAVFGPIAAFLRESYGWHAVRLLTMACGILQVEVCYRASRRVFPNRDDVQTLGAVVGGLMPMNVYLSQALGNEPLAGLLSGMTLAIGLGFLDGEYAARPKWWIALGLTWGLAMLAKATPVLLGAPLLVMCLRGAILRRMPPARITAAAAVILGGASAVCGWYYVRNWLVLGRPFVGGWDPARGIVWWQDPGYRTAEHFVCFGESLRHPVWAGYAGLWDGLYSTMWYDGYLLGTIWTSRPPWNGLLLICSAALALIPLGTMCAGGVRAAFTGRSSLRWAIGVSLLTIGVLLAAVVSLYLRLPVYSASKGTYLMGALPCFAILAGAGYDSLPDGRSRRFLQAGLLTWASCVYAAYFIV